MGRIRYQEIADGIAARIGSGALRPGAQLPTIRALMREHRVALATASRVYAELEAVGLVAGETGRGTFVRDTSLPRGCVQQMFDRAGAWQMQDDLVLALSDLHGDLEQLGDRRRWLRLRQRGVPQRLCSQLLVQDTGGAM